MSSVCIGSGHIGQYLLSGRVSSAPILVELLWGPVAQGLVRSHSLVDVVPGQEGCLQPAQVGGQLLHLVELLLVGAEAPLNTSVTLGIVGAVEVVAQFQLLHCGAKGAQELA